MTIYLTTANLICRDGPCCYICEDEPTPDERGGWLPPTGQCICVGHIRTSDLATLGFPPPGECREYEIPPYEEETDGN